MLLKALLFVLVHACMLLQPPILSPDIYDALLNSSLELTCYAPKDIKNTKWGTRNQVALFSYLTFRKEGECNTTGFLADSNYFETKCYSNATFKVNIKRINISNHGQEWYCSNEFQESNKAYITVQVPAVHVDINVMESINITENDSLNVTCNTSDCRPKPEIKWYVRNAKDATKYDVTEHAKQYYIPQENGFTSAESKLQIIPNRTVNNWVLYCEVWTGSNNADISSQEVVLNVFYPPERPPKINGYPNGTQLQVNKSESDELNCSSPESNPLPTLSVACFITNSTVVYSSNSSTTSSITWKAKRNYSKCTCESDHIIGGKQETSVTIDVLFPPSYVRFRFLREELGDSTHVVNKGDDVPFICTTESNPNSKMTIKSPKKEQIAVTKNTTISRHTIHNVSCDDAGEYICSARNMLTVSLQAISKLNLIVRCPPTPSTGNIIQNKVKVLLHHVVTMGFIAQDYFDKWNKTSLTWYKQNITLESDGNKYIILSYGLQTNLIIRNVEASDFGEYHILVRNSVGEYTHYYELQRIDKQDCIESTLKVTLFLIAGVFAFTIPVVVLIVMIYRNIRSRKEFGPKCNRKADGGQENQGTVNYDSNHATKYRTHVYEDPHEMKIMGKGQFPSLYEKVK